MEIKIMSKLDELLKQVEAEKTSERVIVVQESKGGVSILNIVLIAALLGMGYLLWTKWDNKPNPGPGPDPIPVVNVVEKVTEMENLYSKYKGDSYEKLAELVENKTINNQEQLLTNAQAILSEARKASLGKLDELDNEMLPKGDWNEGDKRNRVVMYLMDKSKGFLEAGK